MTIFGQDASDFDWGRGPMDLAAARRDGIDFFTHKATEGLTTRHKRYGEALRRARDAGIPFLGAYGIPRSSGTAAAQVDYFLAYVEQQTPWWRDWPGWFFQVDLEHWAYDKVPPGRGVEWCNLLRQRTGRQVLLYAPKWAYGDSIGGSDPLWQSAYGTNPPGHYRALYPGDNSSRWAPYSKRIPQILQYGSRATIGRQSGCDVNAFRGTAADFARLIGAAPSTPAAEGADVELTDLINIPTYEAPASGIGVTLPPAEALPASIVLGSTYRRTYLGLKTAEASLAILQAIAKKVDLDPQELIEIEERAKAGALEALAEYQQAHQADFIAALLAALPTAAVSGYTVDQVQAAVRAVFADAGQAGDAPTG